MDNGLWQGSTMWGVKITEQDKDYRSEKIIFLTLR